MGEPIPEGEPPRGDQGKPKDTKHICPECGRVYSYPRRLSAHLVTTHNYTPVPPPPKTEGGVLVSNIWLDDAFKRGYNVGWQEGYDAGRIEGYHKGFRDGRREGFREGKAEGYEEGYSDAQYDESDRD